jgi:hypothetical protein
MILSTHRDPSACEHQAARLLPWLVAGALDENEAQRVQAHVAECGICKEDVDREQRVLALMQDEPAVEHAPQPGLQNLLARIDELERELPASTAQDAVVTAPARRRFTKVPWLAAASIVQAIGLGILGVMLWNRGVELQAPRFHTMTSSSPAAASHAQIRVVFSPNMKVSEMQELLKSIPATVVAGPTDAGVYTLAIAGERTEIGPVLNELRAHSSVLFAEPRGSAARGE